MWFQNRRRNKQEAEKRMTKNTTLAEKITVQKITKTVKQETVTRQLRKNKN